MKKTLFILLAVVMLLSVVACNNGATESQSPDADGQTSMNPSEDSPTPDDGDMNAGEPVVISLSNFDTVNGYNNECLVEFVRYVEEISDGNITFKTYYGGTLAGLAEEYDYLISGSIDMIATLPSLAADKNPFIYNVNSYSRDVEDALNLAWYFLIEDPTCSAIVDKYCEMEGIKCLGTQQAGASIILANQYFETYEDLKGVKFGAGRDLDVYVEMGLNTVNVPPADVYDSLSRGVCDTYMYTASNSLTNYLYEPAPYGYNTYVYGNSQTYLINRDKWDSMSEQQQVWMEEGMDYIRGWSVEKDHEYEVALSEVCDSWVEATEDDAMWLCTLMEKASAKSLIESAQNLHGEEGRDDMITLILAREEWLGIEILPEEYTSYR